VAGDLVSNVNVADVVRVHKERRKLNKYVIMMMLVKETGGRHRTRCVLFATRPPIPFRRCYLFPQYGICADMLRMTDHAASQLCSSSTRRPTSAYTISRFWVTRQQRLRASRARSSRRTQKCQAGTISWTASSTCVPPRCASEFPATCDLCFMTSRIFFLRFVAPHCSEIILTTWTFGGTLCTA
jgi:hypothetical protein